MTLLTPATMPSSGTPPVQAAAAAASALAAAACLVAHCTRAYAPPAATPPLAEHKDVVAGEDEVGAAQKLTFGAMQDSTASLTAGGETVPRPATISRLPVHHH